MTYVGTEQLSHPLNPGLPNAVGALATGHSVASGERLTVTVPDDDRQADQMDGIMATDELPDCTVGAGSIPELPISMAIDYVDEQSFTAIVEEFEEPLYRFISHLIGDEEQANDLTQITLIKAWRSPRLPTVISDGWLSAWLYRIARNTAIDELRKRNRIAFCSLSVPPPNDDGGFINTPVVNPRQMEYAEVLPDPASNVFEQRVADGEELTYILNNMPDRYRTYLLLQVRDGLTCEEIAKRLKTTVPAVKMKLVRARKKANEVKQAWDNLDTA